ncbi:MAG: hypothetical protein WDO68_04300 [Gammaproteobacteria bacterium]
MAEIVMQRLLIADAVRREMLDCLLQLIVGQLDIGKPAPIREQSGQFAKCLRPFPGPEVDTGEINAIARIGTGRAPARKRSDIDMAEIGPSKIGTAEVGPGRAEAAQVGAVEMRKREVGSLEMRA